MPKVTLNVSLEVPPGDTNCDTVYTPASGEEVVVSNFDASVMYSQTSNVRLVWDKGGAGEKLIWSIKGGGRMPFRHKIYPTATDGTKKLTVCLENQEAASAFFSAHVKLEVELP